MRIYILVLWIGLLTACVPLKTPLPRSAEAGPTEAPNDTPTAPPSASPSASPAATGTLMASGLAWANWMSDEPSFTLTYPADWSVTETTDGATFTGPQGAVIQLAILAQLTGDEPLPNTRCSTNLNPNGVAVETCQDTLAGNYTASFSLAEHKIWLMMTAKPPDLATFNGMLASIKPTP